MPARGAAGAPAAAAGGFLDRGEILRRAVELRASAPGLRLGAYGKAGKKNGRSNGGR
jgi:hypothetical protein